MIVQDRDNSHSRGPQRGQHLKAMRYGYYAAVPARLLDGEKDVIDELIGFVFDTLGASHLDVRVYDETTTQSHRTASAT